MSNDNSLYKREDKITSVKNLVDLTYKKFPNEIFCSYYSNNNLETKTYSEMYHFAKSIGFAIRKNDANRNLHVAMLGETTYEWLSAYIGMLYNGIVVVPLDRLLKKNDILNQVDFADVDLLIYDKKYEEIANFVESNSTKCKKFICLNSCSSISENIYDFINKYDWKSEEDHVIDVNTMTEIVFTSGTTGTSKGVMISHKNIVSAILIAIQKLDFYPNEVMLTLLPNNHLYMLTIGILTFTYFGMNLALNESILYINQDFRRFKPHCMVVVPSVLYMMQKKILVSLTNMEKERLFSKNDSRKEEVVQKIRQELGGNFRGIICGGAFLRQETIDFFEMIGIPIIEGYGITECSPLISVNKQGFKNVDKRGSVGAADIVCEARCVEEEIWVKGDNVMLGYYKNPELTASVFEDGWYKTGDLGKVDEDKYIFIYGRKKNLIILSNGENVCPEEIEDLLAKIEAIDSVVVYEENEMITAEVYTNKEYIKKIKIEDEYTYIKKEIGVLNKEIPIYKQVQVLKIRETPFQMTTTMKIKR